MAGAAAGHRGDICLKPIGAKRIGSGQASNASRSLLAPVPPEKLVSIWQAGAATSREEEELVSHTMACKEGVITCVRCKYAENHKAWKARCPFALDGNDPPPGLPRSWLFSRTDINNGSWGIGCIICAAAGRTTSYGIFPVGSNA